ncbi:Crp/Fnr family transcriptional regulator [Tunicatimonas pelagia]|uniref:Crp/Fnr family transcriptional regulator n=1 Tax=Tunicatimonas pelagia TaxID=931531 RepID=UPI0026660BE2|nr:Crp/Fnr family transcriptional regulator [Tunicatimonas pelagia]WKN46093.1 Crp/Fnr family transcriptional regulator [Tunicatimonas pelagia]
MAPKSAALKSYLENFAQGARYFIQPACYKKGQLLHRSGYTCFDLFIFHKGVGRSFYYKDGLDITSHFVVDFGIISAIDSLVTRKPSKYNIEVLEDAKVSRININQYEKFLSENPHHEKSARQLTQVIYFELAERIEGLMFHTAHERYQRLTDEYPDIVNRVNLGHIATFLGISQETLSRIRKIKG